MNNDLINFIKYCLGYVRITRARSTFSQQKYSLEISSNYLNLVGLLNGDVDEKLGEMINLDFFYKYDPNNVPEEEIEIYKAQKGIANQIEEVYNKYKNDVYTKQIILSFGYIELEIPDVDNTEVLTMSEEDEQDRLVETKVNRYPLFSLPVRIDKESVKGDIWKYFVYAIDTEVQVNIGILESVLGEDSYFQLVEEMGRYEMENKLSIPITQLDIFTNIWHKIKGQLRLKDAKFDENSFSLDEMKISLGLKSNYFLAEDLLKLSKIDESDLSRTALMSWVQDDELNVHEPVPHEGDLYFPFLYDKYQLKILSVLGNKASMVQGPPGTGKSETIANLLCHLAATGKRVLFVSQKAQALKVVKDKLKTLNIKYLFGYLPNPNSAQIDEDDEADGIAPQLSALNTYINKIGYSGQLNAYTNTSYVPIIRKDVQKRDAFREDFRSIIEIQRRYYKLHEELETLKEYDIQIPNIDLFKIKLTTPIWNRIHEIKSSIEKISLSINMYERTGEKKRFDSLFSMIDQSDRKYARIIKIISDDVSKTGYDRTSTFLRKINNMKRKFRLLEQRKELPYEILEYVDKSLKNGSKIQQKKKLHYLYQYFQQREMVEEFKDSEGKLEEVLSSCGITHNELNETIELISRTQASEIEDIRDKIVRVQEIKELLHKVTQTQSLNDLGYSVRVSEQDRSNHVSQYIQNIINKAIIEKWSSGGVTVRQIVRKLASAFNKSKKAFKTFDNLRKDVNNFNAMLDLIPIWIMELDDASRIIPLEAGIFDYVILDEASQCNVAYTLPVMYRANKVVFVGDPEQMRDSTVMFKSNRVFDDLARRYDVKEERQIKTTGSSVQSVLDIADKRGFMSIPLQYHYRSPVELIGFSNKYFYKPKGKDLIPLNSNYLTFKDTNRVMIIHEIKADIDGEITDRVNIAEARKILELFRELRNDDRYHDKSIGILTFFNAQATYIRELFESEGLKEEENNYKVSIIEGIQGDEKDVIIYSFVIRSVDQKNKYIPLTGESGDIRADINRGRVNVAFSRARLQVHCVTSMSVKDMPSGIWLKKYLEYVHDYGEVTFYSKELKPFDSYFEEEFFGLTRAKLDKSYLIQNQVKSCGFKIDFVISNMMSGKRIAVECDGPCHFRNEIDDAYGIYVDGDDERQRVLEAAGWKFCRIKYSDWINPSFRKETVVETLIKLLN